MKAQRKRGAGRGEKKSAIVRPMRAPAATGAGRKGMRLFLCMPMLLFLYGCMGVPAGIRPVDGFDLDRYLGRWYEIARLDHPFERGLERVTADYSLRDDGGVKVVNRGFSRDEETWKEAEGRAYFAGGQNEGYLKVSFFGPFYGSYVIFELDKENYQYAFVTGPNRSYLWFLSRTPTVRKGLTDRFITRSRELGFDTDKLIFVEQPGDRSGAGYEAEEDLWKNVQTGRGQR